MNVTTHAENKNSSTPQTPDTSSIRGRLTLPDRVAHIVFWPVLGVGLLADLWTKHAVFAWLQGRPGQTYVIIKGFLRLAMVENDGAAFGIGAGRLPFLIGVSVVALIVILGMFLLGRDRRKIMLVIYAMFAAGVCGNLWDRAFNAGLVRDFIDFSFWPAFNVADSLLCIAVGLLLLAAVLTPQSAQKPRPKQKSESA